MTEDKVTVGSRVIISRQGNEYDAEVLTVNLAGRDNLAVAKFLDRDGREFACTVSTNGPKQNYPHIVRVKGRVLYRDIYANGGMSNWRHSIKSGSTDKQKLATISIEEGVENSARLIQS